MAPAFHHTNEQSEPFDDRPSKRPRYDAASRSQTDASNPYGRRDGRADNGARRRSEANTVLTRPAMASSEQRCADKLHGTTSWPSSNTNSRRASPIRTDSRMTSGANTPINSLLPLVPVNKSSDPHRPAIASVMEVQQPTTQKPKDSGDSEQVPGSQFSQKVIGILPGVFAAFRKQDEAKTILEKERQRQKDYAKFHRRDEKVLAELDRNVKSYEEVRKAAEDEIVKHISQLDTDVRSICALLPQTTKNAVTRDEMNELKKQFSTHQAQVEERQQTYDKYTDKLESQIKELVAKNSKLPHTIHEFEQDIVGLGEIVRNKLDEVNQLKQDVDQDKRQIRDQNDRLKSLEIKLDAVQRIVEKAATSQDMEDKLRRQSDRFQVLVKEEVHKSENKLSGDISEKEGVCVSLVTELTGTLETLESKVNNTFDKHKENFDLYIKIFNELDDRITNTPQASSTPAVMLDSPENEASKLKPIQMKLERLDERNLTILDLLKTMQQALDHVMQQEKAFDGRIVALNERATKTEDLLQQLQAIKASSDKDRFQELEDKMRTFEKTINLANKDLYNTFNEVKSIKQEFKQLPPPCSHTARDIGLGSPQQQCTAKVPRAIDLEAQQDHIIGNTLQRLFVHMENRLAPQTEAIQSLEMRMSNLNTTMLANHIMDQLRKRLALEPGVVDGPAMAGHIGNLQKNLIAANQTIYSLQERVYHLERQGVTNTSASTANAPPTIDDQFKTESKRMFDALDADLKHLFTVAEGINADKGPLKAELLKQLQDLKFHFAQMVEEAKSKSDAATVLEQRVRELEAQMKKNSSSVDQLRLNYIKRGVVVDLSD